MPRVATTAPDRLRFDVPDGWFCVDLESVAQPDQLREPTTAPDGPADTEAGQSAQDVAHWLREQGASTALLRPGDEAVPSAICGGMFLLDELAIDGDALYVALEQDGEPVALGDLDGIPIISHVRHAPPDEAMMPVPTVHVTYFICAPRMCIVITFVAPEIAGTKSVVDEVAKIVSAVRVVHSDAGCPV